MVAAVKGRFTHAPRGNGLVIFVGVAAGLVLAGLPLLNKRVYQTEQQMAHLRDSQYDSMDAKNVARDSRLRAGVKLPGSSAPGSSSGGGGGS